MKTLKLKKITCPVMYDVTGQMFWLSIAVWHIAQEFDDLS